MDHVATSGVVHVGGRPDEPQTCPPLWPTSNRLKKGREKWPKKRGTEGGAAGDREAQQPTSLQGGVATVRQGAAKTETPPDITTRAVFGATETRSAPSRATRRSEKGGATTRVKRAQRGTYSQWPRTGRAAPVRASALRLRLYARVLSQVSARSVTYSRKCVRNLISNQSSFKRKHCDVVRASVCGTVWL